MPTKQESIMNSNVDELAADLSEYIRIAPGKSSDFNHYKPGSFKASVKADAIEIDAYFDYLENRGQFKDFLETEFGLKAEVTHYGVNASSIFTIPLDGTNDITKSGELVKAAIHRRKIDIMNEANQKFADTVTHVLGKNPDPVLQEAIADQVQQYASSLSQPSDSIHPVEIENLEAIYQRHLGETR
jgi:hypothetical protein